MIYTPMSAMATAACMGCYVPLTGQSAASAGHTSYRSEYRADYEPYHPLDAVASFPALSSLAPLSSRKAVRNADAYYSSGSSSAPSTAPSTASSTCSDDWSSSSNASARSTGSWLSRAISRAVGISSTKRSRADRTRQAGMAAAN